MNTFSKAFRADIHPSSTNLHRINRILLLAVFVYLATPFHLSAATNVSGQVSVTHTGFGLNRATGIWSATLTVKNTSGSALSGPIQVVLTNLSSNATMVNKTGVSDGSPYITVESETLAPGASASVVIQFTNSTSDFISFEPVTYAGGL